MQHLHPAFRSRYQLCEHLRDQHAWTEETWARTIEGVYVDATSELLATHRELHQLARLDEKLAQLQGGGHP